MSYGGAPFLAGKVFQAFPAFLGGPGGLSSSWPPAGRGEAWAASLGNLHCAGFPLSSALFLGGFLAFLGFLWALFLLAGKNSLLVRDLQKVSEELKVKVDREKELRKNWFYQSALAGLRKLALSMGPYEDLLRETVDLLKDTLDIQGVQILAYEAGKKYFRLEKAWGWEGDLEGTLRFPAEPGPVETFALEGRECRACSWTAGDPRFVPAPHVGSAGFHSSLNVCIPGDEMPYGVLSILRKGREPFDPEEGSFLEVVADILGDAFRVQSTVKKLKREEERLEMVLKGACLGTWSWRVREDRIHLDRRFMGLLGEEGEGRDASLSEFKEMINREDLGGMERSLERHFAGETESFDWEGRFRTGAGEWRWLHVRGRVLERGEGGSPSRMAGVAQDVTEKKQLEAQLFQAQKLESVGRLAAGIAHEINTPTQYVSDNTMFLKESGKDLLKFVQEVEKLLLEEFPGALPPELKEKFRGLLEDLDMEFLLEEVPKAIDQSLEGLGRVTRIVRAMKDFSHPGSGVQEPVDLNKAIQSTVTIARNEWKYVSDLETDLDPELPLVKCYAGDLNQVILNLVVNAAHAIGEVVKDEPGKKGKITITTKKAGEWAEIRVRDTGTGIPEEIREKIFEPFFTTKPVGKGTGQGLSLVYSVIKGKHGGEIDLESEVGEGTTFILRIPLEGKKEAGAEGTGEKRERALLGRTS